jgi:predicted transposase YdaD
MKGVAATELEDLAQLATHAAWDERTRIDVIALLTLFGGRRFGQDVVSSMVRRLGMLKDIIQESPLYELAREYGETRGEARGLRNACLALTKTKAPQLVPVLEGHLGDIADLPQLEKLLVDLGLAQNEEAVQSAISRHLG